MDENPVQEFLSKVTQWGIASDNISAILLVGSHARGEARPDSDVDIVILAEIPGRYLDEQLWLERFGDPLRVSIEDWGLVKSLRVWYEGGLEVEFGFTSDAWLSIPMDAGTKNVLSDGFHLLVDKGNFSSKLDV